MIRVWIKQINETIYIHCYVHVYGINRKEEMDRIYMVFLYLPNIFVFLYLAIRNIAAETCDSHIGCVASLKTRVKSLNSATSNKANIIHVHIEKEIYQCAKKTQSDKICG